MTPTQPTITESKTGYYSLLVCVHKDAVCFYRTGKEIAILHLPDRVEWSENATEDDKIVMAHGLLEFADHLMHAFPTTAQAMARLPK